MIPLKDHYKSNVIQELKDSLNLDSIMAVPKGYQSYLEYGCGRGYE